MQYIMFPKFLCPTRARFRAAVASLTYQTFHSIPTRSLSPSLALPSAAPSSSARANLTAAAAPARGRGRKHCTPTRAGCVAWLRPQASAGLRGVGLCRLSLSLALFTAATPPPDDATTPSNDVGSESTLALRCCRFKSLNSQVK